MKIEFGYGQGTQTVCIPDENLLGLLRPNSVQIGETGSRLVERALETPIGSPALCAMAKPRKKTVIITSDVTRPVPSYAILPPLLSELWAAGLRPCDVTVVFALGSHRRHTEAEMRRLVGDVVYEAVRCVDGDPADCVSMGVTRAGTPVDITRIVAEAEFRIGVGNIEYHYFAGYSGGAKAIMPGVSTRAAIQANHSLMVLPNAAAGVLEGNPVRADIEEALDYCPLHFIVNVVLDEHKQILYCAAGHPIMAHRAGCRFLDSLYRVPIPCRADIVIAGQGGYPKDLNLYQTQKALDNAKHAVRDGGIVILVGSCVEGMGEKTFERWMMQAKRPSELIEQVRTKLSVGGIRRRPSRWCWREPKSFWSAR